MDVDGPLNPFEAPWFLQATPAPGYEFHELTPAGGVTYRVALNRFHGEELGRLATSFDLAWATTWLDDANRLISPILGLPQDLPVVPLERPMVNRSRRCWKTDQIAAWVGERSFAWFDDEINRPTRKWLDDQSSLASHLALRVSAETGLSGEDIEQLTGFAAKPV
jgi:hypothetical protein